jgi:hypothetical protein
VHNLTEGTFHKDTIIGQGFPNLVLQAKVGHGNFFGGLSRKSQNIKIE